jgi:hypothetical protein
VRRFIIRLRRLLGELDYAQRRCLELRTGVRFTGPAEPSRRARREAAALDDVWALEPAGQTARTGADAGTDGG